MVRAGIVGHPSQWKWCGYNEIQKPRRRNVIIDYQKLMALSGFETYDIFQTEHKRWVEHALNTDELKRESHWTQSIATGSKSFIQEIHSKFGVQARGKKIIETRDGYHVCEEIISYNSLLGTEKGIIEGENCLFWDGNL